MNGAKPYQSLYKLKRYSRLMQFDRFSGVTVSYNLTNTNNDSGDAMNDWQSDLVRYGMRRPFLKEQSIWAVWLYRQGRRIDLRSAGPGKKFQTTLYWLAFRVVETMTGVSLPKSATIGPGLRIWHFGSIFIHPDTKIGANCTLRQGVTIGNRHVDGPVPVLGDDVEIGAYAQILGGVKIGNNCRIGAMSVVLTDMPDGSTAVGAPARLVFQPQVDVPVEQAIAA